MRRRPQQGTDRRPSRRCLAVHVVTITSLTHQLLLRSPVPPFTQERGEQPPFLTTRGASATHRHTYTYHTNRVRRESTKISNNSTAHVHQIVHGRGGTDRREEPGGPRATRTPYRRGLSCRRHMPERTMDPGWTGDPSRQRSILAFLGVQDTAGVISPSPSPPPSPVRPCLMTPATTYLEQHRTYHHHLMRGACRTPSRNRISNRTALNTFSNTARPALLQTHERDPSIAGTTLEKRIASRSKSMAGGGRPRTTSIPRSTRLT